jgi:hypothetical protein
MRILVCFATPLARAGFIPRVRPGCGGFIGWSLPKGMLLNDSVLLAYDVDRLLQLIKNKLAFDKRANPLSTGRVR